MYAHDYLSQYEDYKEFFNEWVDALPKNGHGEYRRLAMSLNISTTMVSQVFKGEKELSLELACELCDYLKLTEDETDYFLLLVEYRRSGSTKLKTRLLKQIQERQAKAKKLENRLKKEVVLTEETRAVFYSSWVYSGIRLLASCEGFNDAATIAQRLNLPRNQVQKALDFLLSNGLLIQKKGQFELGPTRTYLGSSNLLASRQHQNWRLLGFSKMAHEDSNNLFFTGPMSLSKEAVDILRQDISNLIDKTIKLVGPTKSETTHCLNIDWFGF